MFELFSLQGRVDPIYHVVVRLLLLLFHLRELLEVLLSIDRIIGNLLVAVGGGTGELTIISTYVFLELPLETPAKAGGRPFEIFGFIILLKVCRISSSCA